MERTPKSNPEHGDENVASGGSAAVSSRARESVSAFSDLNLSALSKGFCESLENIRKVGAKYRRVWLIRHFPLEKTKANEDYEKRATSDKSEMGTEAMKKLREDDTNAPADVSDPKTQAIFRHAVRQSPQGVSIALCVDNSDLVRVRNKMTQDWIRSDGILEGKFHERSAILSIQKDADSGKNAISSSEQVRAVVNGILQTDHEGVLIGNRSLAWAFGLRAGRSYVSVKEAARRFGETGYDFIDFENENPEKIILADADILRITPENAKPAISAVLAAATCAEEKAAITEALGSMPLACLQEAVNAGLGKLEAASPESYARFLFSLMEKDGGGDPEIQKFVFSKFVKLDGSTVRLLENKWNSKVLEWMAAKNYREFVIKYFGETEEGPSDSAWMFSKAFMDKKTEGLYESACQYWKARKKQKRSVDPAIRERNDGAILPRSVYYSAPISKTPEGAESETSLKSLDYADVFEKSRTSNLVLSGRTGEGKSIWLTEFAKWAILSGKKAKFVEAKAIKPEHLAQGGRLRSELEDPDAVLCVDAIDEVRDEKTRSEIVRALNGLGKRCVITSRPSDSDGFSGSSEMLGLRQLNADEFVSARTENDEAKRKIIEALGKMGMSRRFHSNPLILSFACLLQEEADFATKTKTQFMERIARFVLSKHAKESKGQDFTDEDVDAWMDKLGKYAFEKHLGEERVERNPSFDAHLALLFKDGEDGGYDFVHASFYEHFLARYAASVEAPWEIVMEWKRSSRKTEWTVGRKIWKYRIPVIESIVRMLSDKGEWNKVAEIAHELITDPDDDLTGTGFFLGLEILERASASPESDLDEYKRFAYSEIAEWGDEELALRLPNLKEFARRNGYPEIPEIDSHVIPVLESLNGRDVIRSVSDQETDAEKVSKSEKSAGYVEFSFKSHEEVNREFAASVLLYAKNGALGSKTWLPVPGKARWSTAMRTAISSLGSKSSLNGSLKLLRQLKSAPDSVFVQKSWNDYRLALIADFARAYEKFRVAGKMDADDVPTLLREVNSKNPRQIVSAARDALAINDTAIWRSATFELLKAYFGLNETGEAPGWMALPPEHYEPLEEISSDCAGLLMEMGIDVRALRMTGNRLEDLESLRDLTDAETFESKLLRDNRIYARSYPKKPEAYSGTPKKKRFLRMLARTRDGDSLLDGEPSELFDLVKRNSESGNLPEAIRISECAYRYYGLRYA